MSLLSRLFRFRLFGFRPLSSRPDPRENLRPLWHNVVAQARDPVWYREYGAADSTAGRFDMITAILVIVLLRMEKEPDLLSQSALLAELFVEDMDGQLREAGVGDVVVGKHIGRLMSVLGGRLGAYRASLAGGHDTMVEAIIRNITFREGHAADAMARGLVAFSNQLDTIAAEHVLDGSIAP